MNESNLFKIEMFQIVNFVHKITRKSGTKVCQLTLLNLWNLSATSASQSAIQRRHLGGVWGPLPQGKRKKEKKRKKKEKKKKREKEKRERKEKKREKRKK